MNKKMMSQKAQAALEIVPALVLIMLFICKILENINHTRTLHNILNAMSPLIIVVTAVLFIWSSRYGKQPSDELSRELTLKATAVAVKAELCAAVIVGIFMHLQGNRRHDEYFRITGGDVCMFGVFLCGVFFIAKNITFLWLDRTPKAEEDE
ncbi:hypothetical protein [Ruminococcus flavefaciens]|uniref:hypothetical protein n=1 Tax=Ruminococcus flavefaciens TaxID=1265 RepID=UPI0026EAB6D8|nr:hypothetical protein [Ruminococcus flavefaciens]